MLTHLGHLVILSNSFLIKQHTLPHLFLSMEAQLQELGVRCQQFLNKGCRQLCVDLVHNLKTNVELTMTSTECYSKKSNRAVKLYRYTSGPLCLEDCSEKCFAGIIRKE